MIPKLFGIMDHFEHPMTAIYTQERRKVFQLYTQLKSCTQFQKIFRAARSSSTSPVHLLKKHTKQTSEPWMCGALALSISSP